MKNSIILITLCLLLTTQAFPDKSSNPEKESPIEYGVNVELISNGSTYRFTSMHDGSVITVLPNGDVISDVGENRPEQKWVVMEHPDQPLFLEFKQLVVPYNMLSGYEEIPENPDAYPRPLELNKNRIMNNLKVYLNEDELPPVPWQILIRGRYCIQNMGIGKQLEIADCDWQLAPRQLWALKIVE